MPNKSWHQLTEIQLRAKKTIQSLLVLMMGTFFSLTVLADSKPTAREEMNQEYKKGIGGKKYEIDRSPMGSFDYYMERLDSAKKKLSITKEQQGLWSDYEKSLIVFFTDLKRAKARLGGTTAVQQIGQVLGVTQNRYTGMEQIHESARKLYDGLSDSQKKTADEILITTVPSFD